MAKDRYAVTCNGRAAFYACMYEDIRQCAIDCGWAVALHGSLASDMDIMAMPWVDNAVSFKEMVDRVSKLFKDNELSSQYVITYNEKPYNRVVATIPIFADFYLDISTITADVVPKSECAECAEKTRNTIVKLQNQIKFLKKYDEERDIALHGRLVANAKAEVAREIFAEIDVIFRKYYNKCSEPTELKLLEPLFQAERFIINEMWHDVAELKKKYTEGE